MPVYLSAEQRASLLPKFCRASAACGALALPSGCSSGTQCSGGMPIYDQFIDMPGWTVPPRGLDCAAGSFGNWHIFSRYSNSPHHPPPITRHSSLPVIGGAIDEIVR